MSLRVVVKKGLYLDSIFLMRVSDRLAHRPGVVRAAAVMATPANRKVLETAGFAASAIAPAGPDDLVVAIQGATDEAADTAAARLDELLAMPDASRSPRTAHSIEEAAVTAPQATVAVITVPGEHAARLADAALEAGLHPFVFSSGVSVADEVALKRKAHARGLLVMGPDCGTAILGGKGLGFANAVRPGPIGIIGSTGTGIQEISTLIHRWGGGISQAIGTGSRDLTDEVGGISTFDALDVLARDPSTKVIILASKAPGRRTLEALAERVAAVPKAIVLCALGVKDAVPDHAFNANSLDEAAWRAFALAYGRPPSWNDGTPGLAGPPVHLDAAQRYVRGLFSGGTLGAEAKAILGEASVPCTVSDLGAEELVQGRPHPMIDPRLRNERIVEAGADAETGVILIDVVLGFGASADPAGDLSAALVEAREKARSAGRDLAIIASITGIEEDPQVRSSQRARLEESGVVVAASTADAARMAARVLQARLLPPVAAA